jgi:hypothetical protein
MELIKIFIARAEKTLDKNNREFVNYCRIEPEFIQLNFREVSKYFKDDEEFMVNYGAFTQRLIKALKAIIDEKRQYEVTFENWYYLFEIKQKQSVTN